MTISKLPIFLTIVLLGSTLSARVVETSDKVEIESAGEIVVDANLGVGKYVIKSFDDDKTTAAKFDITYDNKYFDYYIDHDYKRDKCYIDIETKLEKNNFRDDIDNDWIISLSKHYPISLEMDIGACEAEFNLGGLRLVELNLDIGASSGYIEFEEVNPVRLKEINIEIGASSLDMINIGNANFDEFYLSGGAGSYDLDFRGEYNGESLIDIEIGVSSADIILPEGIPVRIEADDDGLFSSIDIHGRYVDEVDDEIYESDDFESAKTRIILKLDVGMGSIDVRWK